jgi:uncharacterized protein (TIGR02147 family)
MKRTNRPDIFSYRESVKYISDLVLWYKANHISLRQLSQRLNISPTLLSFITKGKRPLTVENIDLWAPVIGWDTQEVNWLKRLVQLDFSTVDEQKEAIKNLSRFKIYQDESSDEVFTFNYLEKWWNVAIREMSDLADFEEDPEWIQKRLLYKVSLGEIRKSLIFLNKHQMLYKYEENRRLDCQGNVFKLSLSSFHQQILEKAVESIHTVPSAERQILGQTLSLSKDQLPEIKKILNATLEKLIKLSQKDTDEKEVFHIELVAFPLTSKKEES